jgi:hypothetical protein
MNINEDIPMTEPHEGVKVSIKRQNSRKLHQGRLPKNIIIEIFTFLECKQVFKDRLYSLYYHFYQDLNFVGNLFSQMVMKKLGIINDITFEIDYF